MTRHEFSRKTKAAALERSGGRCEAIGARYGFSDGVRCAAYLCVTGVQYDHFPLGAHAEGSNVLENCTATCPACNQRAANRIDKAVEAKIKRRRRKAGLIPDNRKPRPVIRSAGFRKGGPKAKIPSRPLRTKTK